jgi:hypothetical protein
MVELIMAVGFIAELGARWRDIRTAQPARGDRRPTFPIRTMAAWRWFDKSVCRR